MASERAVRWVQTVFAAGLLVAVVAGCGRAGPRPPGPNVAGLPLLKAEHSLDAHHLQFIEHLEGGRLAIGKHGGTIRRGWTVCHESYINTRTVKLDTEKRTSC